ncbi:uncharacterized protein LOC135200049 isoform X3 [Macrobrachium nipponense]|uniref:uncharacterized protein LOC135200049 isoform X3 n=1 Tax=Macrobrachium nipponense TaxID=159736 RepID=UPI0030C7AED4
MTNAGDMNPAMMTSDCSLSETDFSDITAAVESIEGVFKQAKWVHEKCVGKRGEWTTKLSSAESEVHQAVHEQFGKALSYLELLEDQFKTGRIKAAKECKDLPFQEANTLLDIAGKIMMEIKSVEVVPKITFHKAEEFFNDENLPRFGYLATLEVLPHQVVLLYPNNIVCGPVVFVVQVPQTRFMKTLTKSIESTIQVGERDPENLRVYQRNNNLEIVLNVENKETHVLSVKLYHQHVVGSPFMFHPTSNKLLPEDVKNESSASHPLREDFDWVTDSTSEEEEFLSMTEEILRNQMSCTGIRMARKSLLGKKQNLIRKRVKSEELMDMCRKEKVSHRFTSWQAPTVEADIENPANHEGKVDQFTNGNIADDEDDYEEKTLAAMISNKQSDDIMHKPTRKAVKLSKPLRRPRLPACLTNVPGCFTYTDELVGEQHESSQELTESRENADDFCKAEKKNEMAMTHQSEHFSKLIEDLSDKEEEYNVELENGSARVSNKYCFMGETCFHQKIIGVCTSRQDDWRNASEDETFNYMLSQISLFPGKQRNMEDKANKVQLESQQDDDDDDDYETERQVLNDCPHSLSAELVYIAYGPPDDSLFKPIGVAELQDGKVVVADTFNDRIALFDSSGEFIKYFRTQSMRRPSALLPFRMVDMLLKIHIASPYFQMMSVLITRL